MARSSESSSTSTSVIGVLRREYGKSPVRLPARFHGVATASALADVNRCAAGQHYDHLGGVVAGCHHDLSRVVSTKLAARDQPLQFRAGNAKEGGVRGEAIGKRRGVGTAEGDDPHQA